MGDLGAQAPQHPDFEKREQGDREIGRKGENDKGVREKNKEKREKMRKIKKNV